MANNKHTTFDQMKDLVQRQDARDDQQEATLQEHAQKNTQQDTDLGTHVANGTVHITADERAQWNSKAPGYTYGTTDLIAGSSPLATGQMHLVYE